MESSNDRLSEYPEEGVKILDSKTLENWRELDAKTLAQLWWLVQTYMDKVYPKSTSRFISRRNGNINVALTVLGRTLSSSDRTGLYLLKKALKEKSFPEKYSGMYAISSMREMYAKTFFPDKLSGKGI